VITEGFFDETLHKLKKNTAIFQRKDIHLRNKKYVREQEFKCSLKKATKKTLATKQSCASVCINMVEAQKCERIHSHTVRIDFAGKFKVEPKNHFGEVYEFLKKSEIRQKDNKKAEGKV
jgi:tRNA isopentenyl-2-thiomethyl-A-37 hydroxylase MiaE